MSRQFGITPTTAAEQLQKAWPPHVPTQPLPAGKGAAITAAELGIKPTGPLTFFVIGDHGGVLDPNPQNAVAGAMEAEPLPAFVYSVGDVAYFLGEEAVYHSQFYEPYSKLNCPIVAIPGNHDGSCIPPRHPLDAFMANFCSTRPGLPPGSEEYRRDTQTQPYCDWTLLHPAVTIIGLYSNVPSGGHLFAEQVEWLDTELKAAPAGVPLIIALHHPPISIDAHHGGSAKMLAALDTAFTSSGRAPQLVLSGHVHDAQFFTRTGVAYVVIGNSGYHNLHKLAPGAHPGEQLAPGIVFEYGDDSEYGFLKLTVEVGVISGEYVGVSKTGVVTPGKHTFSLPAA